MSRAVFITDEFLLSTKEAVRLYRDYAAEMPIIDFHCHLPPGQIADDACFRNLTHAWLDGDHYKWRLMRAAGVSESYCTGDAPDWEKFQQWAATVPLMLRNPLYHWTHLELARFFGINDRLLCPETAESIWCDANAKLAGPDFSARQLMLRSNVTVACTTDDPVDSLEHHLALAEDKSFGVRVFPTWRPDNSMCVELPKVFNEWVDRLSQVADTKIHSWDSFLEALRLRHNFFHDAGCRLSDHGIETIYASEYCDEDVAQMFRKVRGGEELDLVAVLKFKSAMLYELAVMDHEKGWVQQYHIGVLRNNNSRMFGVLGPDTGFDSIGDLEVARPLTSFLDRLDSENKLAKTIIYNINPQDNASLATTLGCFQGEDVRGKMQLGPAWWFLDQKDGMERQMAALSQMGLLGCFVGMVTDSRSFLSYTRHEYFRRILCNLLGREMKEGLIPRDFELVGGMVGDICCNNAATYLGLDLA